MQNLFDSYLSKLKEAVKIKSISTDSVYSSEIQKMAEWLDRELSKIGFSVKIFNGYDNPIILGYLEVNPAYKTVLHYGHYDVQPAELTDGWNSDPFELTEDETKLIARGSVDNKGQYLIYLAAIEKLKNEGNLGYNILFLFEGNEETGSKHLGRFMKENKEDLKCDFVLMSDGEILNNQPTIETTYRGVINCTLTVFGPKGDLHSGLYGGTVINPIHVLNHVLTNLADETGLLNFSIKGNLTLSPQNEENLKNNAFDSQEFYENTGFKRPTQSTDYEYYRSLGFDNIMAVTGITGGYQKEGYRNSITAKASAKLNFRINPVLDPNEVAKIINNQIKKNINKTVKYELKVDDLAPGCVLNNENEYSKKCAKIWQDIHHKKVFYNYCGAVVPIAHDIVEIFKVPVISTGMGNSDCKMHAANENFRKELAEKGLEFVYKFLHK